MRKQIMTMAVTFGMGFWVTACGNGEAHGKEPGGDVSRYPGGETVVEETGTSASFVEREFWLALAEEPGWHLNLARELFVDGQEEDSSQEVAKVAAILNFESRHSHSPREEGLLLASVQELREVARELRYQGGPREGPASLEELDHVEALTYRTIAEHQVTLARDALEAGDARMAGRYIMETTKAIEYGFERAGVEMGTAMASHLHGAREVASEMELEGDGSKEEGRVTLDHLDSAVRGLGEVLTDRRR